MQGRGYPGQPPRGPPARSPEKRPGQGPGPQSPTKMARGPGGMQPAPGRVQGPRRPAPPPHAQQMQDGRGRKPGPQKPAGPPQKWVVIMNCVASRYYCLVKRFGSLVKFLDCLPRDCEFDSPSLQLKLLKYVLVLSRKNALVNQCLTLSMLKNLVCHVWWALQYLALWPMGHL